MMLKAVFTLLLMGCLGLCQAQNVKPIDLETRDKVRSLYGLENDQGELALLLQFSNRYLVLQFDRRLKLRGKSEFTLTKGSRYELLGSIHSEENFTFYFETSKKPRAIHSMAVSRTDFSVSPGIANLELGTRWERWGHLFSGNQLFMLFTGSNSELKILRTKADGSFEERDFQLSNLDKQIIAEPKQAYRSMLELDANHSINTDKTVSLSESYSRKKLYNYQGTPVLSIENFKQVYQTGFKIFDFETGEVREKLFPDREKGLYNRNSFLYDGRLFAVQYGDTEVRMTVTDFESQELLAAYKSHTPTGKLLIPESLKREGGGLWKRSEYTKEKKILTKINKEVGAIAVSIQGGDYLLTLGAYSERLQGSSTGGFWHDSGMYVNDFYYFIGVGSTLFYNFTMDRTDLSLKAGIPDARNVDRVLLNASRVGGDDAVSRSRGIVPWRGRSLVAYQGLRDRKLYISRYEF